MALQTINLRKLLKLMFLQPRDLTSALRDDIREERDRDRGVENGGGDFYGPFWKDAKDHVFGLADLHDMTADRIRGNERRKNLYPALRDGFLLWWNERRRWTNAPFTQIDTPRTRFRVLDLDLVLNIDCVLAVEDGRGSDYYVYPYWFPEPSLNEKSGRIGLWALSQALPQIEASELRVLDIIRGQTYSLDRNPLLGDEEQLLRLNYGRLLQRRQQLRLEYDH